MQLPFLQETNPLSSEGDILEKEGGGEVLKQQ